MSYPVDLELDSPLEVARWRPLVHWLLAFPHLLIAGVLGNVGGILALISWFAIVFTGRLPEGLANFQCLVLRYTARAYSYALWMREPYPPFTFDMTPADPGDDPPVKVEVHPQLEGRNRLTVGLRLIWAIPIMIFVWILVIAAYVVGFIGFFAVLITGAWPVGLRDFLVKVGRLSLRANAYILLLVDDYPPFALE